MQVPSSREQLFAYFKQRYGLTDAELASDLPLVEFMDSLGRLALISFIRQDLGVALEAADVNPENLGSPERIVAYVDRSRIGGR
jgi:acyl carrier protein